MLSALITRTLTQYKVPRSRYLQIEARTSGLFGVLGLHTPQDFLRIKQDTLIRQAFKRMPLEMQEHHT
jgi:hypothetical protein